MTNEEKKIENNLKSLNKKIEELEEKLRIQNSRSIKEVILSSKEKEQYLIKEDYSLEIYGRDLKHIQDLPLELKKVGEYFYLFSIERLNNEPTIRFLEIFPEPEFDLKNIYINREKITKQLDLLNQQIEYIESLKFEDEKEAVQYDIKSLYWQQFILERKLESIKPGIQSSYVRVKNGKKIFTGILKNGRVVFQKYTENNILTDATEIKRMESDFLKEKAKNLIKVKKLNPYIDLLKLIGYILLIGVLLYFILQFGSYDENQAIESAKIMCEESKKISNSVLNEVRASYSQVNSNLQDQLTFCQDNLKSLTEIAGGNKNIIK